MNCSRIVLMTTTKLTENDLRVLLRGLRAWISEFEMDGDSFSEEKKLADKVERILENDTRQPFDCPSCGADRVFQSQELTA
jgi:hypothetical protein